MVSSRYDFPPDAQRSFAQFDEWTARPVTASVSTYSDTASDRAIVPGTVADFDDFADEPEAANPEREVAGDVPIEPDAAAIATDGLRAQYTNEQAGEPAESLADAGDSPQDPPKEPPETGRAELPDPDPDDEAWNKVMAAAFVDKLFDDNGLQAENGKTIATALGVSPDTVRQLLRGVVTERPDLVRAVAKYLGESDEAAEHLANLQGAYTLKEVMEAADINGTVQAEGLFEEPKSAELFNELTDPDETIANVASHYPSDNKQSMVNTVRHRDNQMAHRVLAYAPHLVPIIREIRELQHISQGQYATRIIDKLTIYMAERGERMSNYLPRVEPRIELDCMDSTISNAQLSVTHNLTTEEADELRRSVIDMVIEDYKRAYPERAASITPGQVSEIRRQDRLEKYAAEREARIEIQRGNWRSIGQDVNVRRLLEGESMADAAERLGLSLIELGKFLECGGEVDEATLRSTLAGFGYSPEETEAKTTEYLMSPKHQKHFENLPRMTPAERAEHIGVTGAELTIGAHEFGVENDDVLSDPQRQALAYLRKNLGASGEALAQHLGVSQSDAEKILRGATSRLVSEHPLLIRKVTEQRSHGIVAIDSTPHRGVIYMLDKRSAEHSIDIRELMPETPLVDPEVDAMLIDPMLSDRAIAARKGLSVRGVGHYRKLMAEHIALALPAVMPETPPVPEAQPPLSLRDQVSEALYTRARERSGSMFEATRAAEINLTRVSEALHGPAPVYSPATIMKLAQSLGYNDDEAFDIMRMHRDSFSTDTEQRTGSVQLLSDLPLAAVEKGFNLNTVILSHEQTRTLGLLFNPRNSVGAICQRLRMSPQQLEANAAMLVQRLHVVPEVRALMRRISG